MTKMFQRVRITLIQHNEDEDGVSVYTKKVVQTKIELPGNVADLMRKDDSYIEKIELPV
jgi:hypothetical protein